MTSMIPQESNQTVLGFASDYVRLDAEKLLNKLYDYMILWNVKYQHVPLRTYLGMEPSDYLLFMQNPESWATMHLSRGASSKMLLS